MALPGGADMNKKAEFDWLIVLIIIVIVMIVVILLFNIGMIIEISTEETMRLESIIATESLENETINYMFYSFRNIFVYYTIPAILFLVIGIWRSEKE